MWRASEHSPVVCDVSVAYDPLSQINMIWAEVYSLLHLCTICLYLPVATLVQTYRVLLDDEGTKVWTIFSRQRNGHGSIFFDPIQSNQSIVRSNLTEPSQNPQVHPTNGHFSALRQKQQNQYISGSQYIQQLTCSEKLICIFTARLNAARCISYNISICLSVTRRYCITSA